MSGWANSHLGLIYQVYGLAFFTLGVVAYVLPRQDTTLRFARDLWLLALFGLLHGVLEFVEWERLTRPSLALATLSPVLLAVSYVPLLEFGRRTLARSGVRLPAVWVYGVAALGVVALAVIISPTLAVLEAGSRYFVGLPGALLSGWSLFALRRSMMASARADGTPNHAHWLTALATALIGYGILTPVVSPGSELAIQVPNTADFVAVTGVPIQLLRAGSAVLATLALIMLVREAGSRSHNNLQRILGTLSGLVYRCNNDRNWSFVYLAGNVEELTGYTTDDFMVRRRITMGGLIHGDDARRVWDTVQTALGEQRDFELSYRIQARDGALRWVYERGRGIYDRDGRLRYLEGHVTDATALMRANESLRIKDAAIESSINAIAISGMDGQITYVNPAYLALWGMDSADEALGHYPHEFMADAQQAQTGIAALTRDGLWQGTIRARRRDGSCFDAQVSANQVRDEAGTPICMMASFIDITEQLRADRALRESAERLSQSQAMAHVGSWEWDIASGALTWTDEHYRIYGYEPGAVAATFELFINAIHPEDRDRVVAQVNHAMREHTPYATEFRIRRPNGEIRITTARGEVRRDASGTPRQMYGMSQDVTARRMADEATRTARRQLQAVIDAATQVSIIATDENGRITLFNHGAERMLGMRAEDMVDRQTPQVFHDAAELATRAEQLGRQYGRPLQGMEVFFEPVRRGDLVPQEWTYIRSDGVRLTVNLGVTALRDEGGRITGYLGIATDVTARAELLARLNKIGRNAPGMIFQFQLRPDGSSCFPYASEGIRDIYGVAPEEVVSDGAITFAYKHPDDLSRINDYIQRSARELTPWQLRYRINHPLKGEIWVEGRASPERLPDGSVLWH
ncbi:MAG: PAS domain-containing protein, partial [Thiobacillus sp.]|nr:PAS domain-containing protein [Thiobacillus sp.]